MGVVAEAIKKAEDLGEEARRVYVEEGRPALAKLLGVQYNTVGHIIKALKFPKEERALVKRQREQHKNPFDQWSPESAYLLGFILGDGSISFKGNKYSLRVYSSDKEIIDSLQQVLPAKVECFRNDGENRKIKSDKPTYVLVSYDFATCQSVVDYGIAPNKSNVGCELKIPDTHRPSFLRGLLDSDGSVYRNSRGIHVACIFYGHPSYMDCLFPCYDLGWKRVVQGSLVGYRLTHYYEVERFLELLYSEPGPFLARKRRVFDEVLEYRQSRKQYIEHYGHRSRFGNVRY